MREATAMLPAQSCAWYVWRGQGTVSDIRGENVGPGGRALLLLGDPRFVGRVEPGDGPLGEHWSRRGFRFMAEPHPEPPPAAEAATETVAETTSEPPASAREEETIRAPGPPRGRRGKVA